ncbi:muramoyltetrapeptide carboxypeptidase LdcA involved in peptidoglycan recycling [Plantactinospora soyae]|uniref:Muramoyltetrapeptide carboxypeptidase LdcA involved in peptidoglycan recycling n=2 Tax=Plantactinospora soyae TaxID=1544732 RepID=A0A927M7Q7_9ACTN|nr:muramoyltetrapeptide carboxypeptidase LdcA involved in peptidoglycan recycling [Plantactinospora soyae]
MILPPGLRPGDAVGLISPSGPVRTPARLARAADALADLGLRPVIGEIGATGRTGAGPAERAGELNAFLGDADIRAVIATIGGHTSSELLPLLDYDALLADPKVIIGYSDITAILLGVYARTGLVTFHGPTALAELGEYPRPLSGTSAGLVAAVRCGDPVGELRPAREWTEEFLAWDRDDHRPRVTRTSDGWAYRGSRVVTGRLIGGNLDTMAALLGTPYFPDLAGAVLFWETLTTDLGEIDRLLHQLVRSGVLDDVVGLLVGRTFRGNPGLEADVRRLVAERFADPDIPVVTGMDIGHTDPMLTLPIGVRARIDPGAQQVEILDAAIR